MKLKYVWLCALCMGISEAKTQVLKIDDLVTLSLQHSPDIDSRRLDFKGAQERTKFAEGYYLPRLDLDAGAGRQHAAFQGQDAISSDILTGSLGASQLLYDFGKTAGNVGNAYQNSLAYEAQLQQSISDKILSVKTLYYDILKSKSIIDVQVKNVRLQKQQLHRAKKYLKSGIKTIIDVSDAQVQVAQAELDLKNAHYDLELKRASLEEALGYVPYAGNYRVYSKKLQMQNVSRQLPRIHTSLHALELYAYKHRYVLAASEYTTRGAEQNVEASQGDYYPSLSLNGSVTKQKVDSGVLAFSPEEQGQITVNMSWNLFSGHQTDATVQEAKIAVLKAASQTQSATLSVKKEVIASHIGLRQGLDNVILTETISSASFKKFTQAQKRYENELSDYVELQDAQQGYIQSLSDLVNAYYDYFIAMADLDHAIGK
ncbi:MAG: hypothetical protein GQ531_03485 [Sulfurovum sp.]|nr:hypothetical protein [Sulfurovum sp.]